MTERFSITNNLAVVSRIAVDYFRPDFFPRESLDRNNLPNLQVDLNPTLSLQISIFFSIVLSNQETVYLCRATPVLTVV